MRQLGTFIIGIAFLLAITFVLRHDFDYVSGVITKNDIRGLVVWQTNWDDALADAAARNKPVLVEFMERSSQSCLDLANKSWLRADIVAATQDYVPVMVDMDARPDLVRQYGIEKVPSLVILDATTRSIIRDARHSNFSPDVLLVWLKPDAQPRWNTSSLWTNSGGDSGNGMMGSQHGAFGGQSNAFSP
jgi:thioredoxin family protein